MHLQVALDRLDLDRAAELAAQVRGHADWIEVGTSLIKHYGMRSVTEVVAAGQQRIKEADEARAQAVSDVRRSWHAAMEKLWHEKWMRVSGMPEPDLDAPPATPEESRRAVQEALLALVDAVSKQRGSLLPRRRKSPAVPDTGYEQA